MEVRKKKYIFESVAEVKRYVDIEKWKKENSEWIDEEIGFSISREADYIVEFLEKNGFYNIKPCWSFSYSQGDGASFTAEWSRPDRWLLKKWVKEYFQKDEEIANIMERLREVVDEYRVTWFKIGNNSYGWHYCHANTKQIDDVEFEADEYIGVVERELEEVISELMSWFENRLEAIAYYEYTDDEIAQIIYENELEVDESCLKEISDGVEK